jgi:hypothetical protein
MDLDGLITLLSLDLYLDYHYILRKILDILFLDEKMNIMKYAMVNFLSIVYSEIEKFSRLSQ